MYKVFFNESELVFKPFEEELKKPPHDTYIKVVHFEEVVQVLEEIEKSGVRKVFLLDCVDFHSIQSNFNCIHSAGGLVQNKHCQWLFIKRMNRWDLPKGRIEAGESSEQAAIREVGEECGIRGHVVVRPLLTSYHIFRSPYYPPPYNWVWKETNWFEMNYAGDEAPAPQQEEDITQARWVDVDDLQKMYKSTYQNIKQLMDFCFPHQQF